MVQRVRAHLVPRNRERTEAEKETTTGCPVVVCRSTEVVRAVAVTTPRKLASGLAPRPLQAFAGAGELSEHSAE